MSRATFGPELMARLEQLARCSTDPDRLNRQPFTPAHREAINQVAIWMRAAGLATRIDALGNLIGRSEGLHPTAPALLMGSHIDTVINAGRFDGPLGILVPLAALQVLHDQGRALPFPVEIIAFCDEEGVRFPTTFLGSKAICGTLELEVLALTDRAGITIKKALEDFGCDPVRLREAAYPPGSIRAFIEVHIEQGPVLEAEDRALGIVSAIQGQSRFAVSIDGVAGHAGTVPMEHRRDALAGAAEAILLLERRCAAYAGVVGTVGLIEALPGAVNVIPGRALFTMDVRAPDDRVRLQAVDEMVAELKQIVARRGLQCAVLREHDQPATSCSPKVQRWLAQALRAEGLPVKYLASGAGHDSMAIATICPVGMLFVRCENGISHNPAESITAGDAELAVRVILRVLKSLADQEDA